MSFTNRALLTSTLQGAPTIARGSITGGNLAVGSFLAAGALGVSAANTWKQGGTRNKWAGGIMGSGSAAFGIAGIASLLAPLFPLLAPVAPIALAVGAIAAGIGLIVKFWPQITDFFKSILSFLGIIADKDKNGGYPGGAPSFFENINKDFTLDFILKCNDKSFELQNISNDTLEKIYPHFDEMEEILNKHFSGM